LWQPINANEFQGEAAQFVKIYGEIRHAPFWSKPLWGGDFLGLKAPSLKDAIGIAVSIVTCGGGVPALLLNLVDDFVFTAMDVAMGNMTWDEGLVSLGKAGASAVVGNAIGGAFGGAMIADPSSIGQVVNNTVVKGVEKLANNVVVGAINSIEYRSGGEFGFNTKGYVKGMIGTDALAGYAGAMGGEFVSSGLKSMYMGKATKLPDGTVVSYAKQGNATLDQMNMFKSTTEVVGNLAYAGIEYGISGHTSVNILNFRDLAKAFGFNWFRKQITDPNTGESRYTDEWNSVGMFELTFDRDRGISSRIGEGGIDLSIGNIVEAFQGLSIFNRPEPSMSFNTGSGPISIKGINLDILSQLIGQTVLGEDEKENTGEVNGENAIQKAFSSALNSLTGLIEGGNEESVVKAIEEREETTEEEEIDITQPESDRERSGYWARLMKTLDQKDHNQNIAHINHDPNTDLGVYTEAEMKEKYADEYKLYQQKTAREKMINNAVVENKKLDKINLINTLDAVITDVEGSIGVNRALHGEITVDMTEDQIKQEYRNVMADFSSNNLVDYMKYVNSPDFRNRLTIGQDDILGQMYYMNNDYALPYLTEHIKSGIDSVQMRNINDFINKASTDQLEQVSGVTFDQFLYDTKRIYDYKVTTTVKADVYGKYHKMYYKESALDFVSQQVFEKLTGMPTDSLCYFSNFFNSARYEFGKDRVTIEAGIESIREGYNQTPHKYIKGNGSTDYRYVPDLILKHAGLGKTYKFDFIGEYPELNDFYGALNEIDKNDGLSNVYVDFDRRKMENIDAQHHILMYGLINFSQFYDSSMNEVDPNYFVNTMRYNNATLGKMVNPWWNNNIESGYTQYDWDYTHYILNAKIYRWSKK